MAPALIKTVVLLAVALFLSEDTTFTTDALSVTTTPAASSAKPPIGLVDEDDPRLLEVKRAMMKFHASEVAGGNEVFARKHSEDDDGPPPGAVSWSDDDFIGRDIGAKNAGIDASYLPQNGNMLFESRSPVLTDDECSFIIEEARATIARGLIDGDDDDDKEEEERVNAISNSELGEARLSRMPRTRAWLRESLPTLFYPLLEDRFGVDDLVLYDGLVLGNIAPTRSQPIHRDASLLTLNIALSARDDYDGGGTYIEALDEVLSIDRGHLLCHAGSAMHAGNAISRGERWVFVLFLLSESRPQLSRRCHAAAIEDLRRGRYESAQTVLAAGLSSIAPHGDHLLHNSLGRLHASGNNPRAALANFRSADAAYPACPQALVAMAGILADGRRPRAALRHLDEVLERIGSRDNAPGAQMSLRSLAFGARRDAARCALICADHLYRSQHAETNGGGGGGDEPQPQPPTHAVGEPPSWASWTLRHLPTAIDRMGTCLAAAPNEPVLLGMLQRAEFLCSEAAAAAAQHQPHDDDDHRRGVGG